MNNIISRNNSNDGIKIEASGATGSKNVVVNNALLLNNDDGIHIRDNSDNFIFTNVIAKNNNKSGILIQDCDNFVVSACNFEENNFNGIGISGSQYFSVNGCTAKNNNFGEAGSAFTASGIKINDYNGKPSLYGTVSGNVLHDTQETATQNYGVRTEDNTDYILITGNILVGNKTGATSLVGSNNVVVNNL
jgi:hypothetical protein